MITVKSLIKPGEYHDSVQLMLCARQLVKLPGVADAAIVMGTEANKALLADAGLASAELASASPNDLVIAVKAEAQAAEAALAEAENLLHQKPAAISGAPGFAQPPRSLRSATRSLSGANLAVISVPGKYAAAEAWEALRQGLHVLLFSDNVTIEDEIALKRYASQAGLLLMGPGAGTAFLNGVGLGFANAVPTGPVGIVSAAGTGLQEVACLLAHLGTGLSQGIGAGGRDLRAEVGGLSMLAGLRALQADPETRAIVLISKPPDAAVAGRVLDLLAKGDKPAVVCFLGDSRPLPAESKGIVFAPTLEAAAVLAARAVGVELPSMEERHAAEAVALEEQAQAMRAGLRPEQRYLRGLYSGGTLCYEAQVIWGGLLDQPVYSNAPLVKAQQLPNSSKSQGHSAIDLGEEEFTVGRPHPMIDNDLRIRRLLSEARDPQTAVLVLDLVLGYGAHPDPASELGEAIRQARAQAAAEGRSLPVVASLTGTSADPQGYERQAALLKEAGVTLCSSNAAAARLVARVVSF